MIEINKSLESKITSYCKVNNIIDINGFVGELLSKSMSTLMYGSSPLERFQMENKIPNNIKNNDIKSEEPAKEVKTTRTRKRVTIVKKNKKKDD